MEDMAMGMAITADMDIPDTGIMDTATLHIGMAAAIGTVTAIGADTATVTGGMVAGGPMVLALAGGWCQVVGSGFATDRN
jgi:hypothetical protein